VIPRVGLVPRRAVALLLLLTAALPAACKRGQTAPGPAIERVMLVVSNRGYFDVNVYAVPASGVAGRRLGTVTGNSSATIFVSGSDLQPGNQLMLFVRAIGGRTGWTSPLVNVGFGVAARLDVYATNSGDLYQSQLYTVASTPPVDTLIDTVRHQ